MERIRGAWTRRAMIRANRWEDSGRLKRGDARLLNLRRPRSPLGPFHKSRQVAVPPNIGLTLVHLLFTINRVPPRFSPV